MLNAAVYKRHYLQCRFTSSDLKSQLFVNELNVFGRNVRERAADFHFAGSLLRPAKNSPTSFPQIRRNAASIQSTIQEIQFYELTKRACCMRIKCGYLHWFKS